MNEPHEPVLECHDVARCFDDGAAVVEVLKGVSLSLAAGDTVAITGASGSGKSTLLHLLGGLDEVDAGEIRVCGHDLHRLRETERARLRNRLLGFVYQFHHLLPEFSALENVAMPLLIGQVGAATAAARAAAMLASVGLEDRASHRPGELSGGERQRVAIARALVTAPRLLLADEPTGNLDQGNAARVCDLLLALCAEHGAALIVVTHDHSIAARMQRRYALSAGRLQALSA